jgi:hypothetical protein
LFAALLVAKEKNKKENFFYNSQFMSWVMAIWDDEPAKPSLWVGGCKQRLAIHCDVIGI